MRKAEVHIVTSEITEYGFSGETGVTMKYW